jgi:hypothetical protein
MYKRRLRLNGVNGLAQGLGSLFVGSHTAVSGLISDSALDRMGEFLESLEKQTHCHRVYRDARAGADQLLPD